MATTFSLKQVETGTSHGPIPHPLSFSKELHQNSHQHFVFSINNHMIWHWISTNPMKTSLDYWHSLTCLCCKIMEHVVLSHIAKHLNANSILLDSQHGFREKLSIVTQFITWCHDWASTIQSRGQTDVVLLAFSKAFDKVPHHRLSAKINY